MQAINQGKDLRSITLGIIEKIAGNIPAMPRQGDTFTDSEKKTLYLGASLILHKRYMRIARDNIGRIITNKRGRPRYRLAYPGEMSIKFCYRVQGEIMLKLGRLADLSTIIDLGEGLGKEAGSLDDLEEQIDMMEFNQYKEWEEVREYEGQ